MQKIGLEFEIETNNTAQELAEVELELQRISAALREAKKSNDGTTYAKLRGEQLKLQEQSQELRKEFKTQIKEFKANKLPSDSIEALRLEYSRLSAELRKTGASDPEFPRRAREAKELNDELKRLEASLGDTRRNVGNYQEAVEGALSNASNAIGGNFSALASGLGVNGLVVAGIDLVADGLQVVSELSKEIITLQGNLSRVTGLQGEELNLSAQRVQALAQTFQVSTDEIIEAANAASQGFGVSLSDALDAVEVGFLSGADANGEFLEVLREYPAVISNTGATLEDLIKLQTQQVRGGIFSDKLIDTIKEADLALKEFTATQEEALLPLGEDFSAQLGKDIREGNITTIDAIEKIGLRAEELGLDLGQLQKITADVFKGAGEDAGGFQNIIENVFQAVKLEYSDLVDETNQLTIAQQNQLRANEEFAAAQTELAELLGNIGTSTETLGVQIRTILLQVLNFLIRRFKQTYEIIRPLIASVRDLLEAMGILNAEGRSTAGVLKVINFIANASKVTFQAVVIVITEYVKQVTRSVNAIRNFGKAIGLVRKQNKQAADDANKATEDIDKGVSELEKRFGAVNQQTKENTTETKEYTNSVRELGEVASQVQKTGLAALNARLAELNTQLANAETEEAFASITSQMESLELQIARTEARYKRFLDLQKGITTLPGTIERRFDNDLPGAVNEIIGATRLEDSAEAARAREVAEVIQSIREDSEAEITRRLKEEQDQRLEDEQEYYQARTAIVQSASEELAGTLVALAADSEATLEDFGRAVLTIALRTAEQTVQLAIAEMYARQLREGIIGIGKAALLQGLITGFTSAIFSTIRSSIQEFAEGGVIQGPANAPTTSKGDNMLVYGKVGEMVLTKTHQATAETIFGKDIWAKLGVPGFSAKPSAAPMLVSPTAPKAANVQMTDEQVVKIAQTLARETAQATAMQTSQSVRAAMDQSNERKIKLERMYKLLAK